MQQSLMIEEGFGAETTHTLRPPKRSFALALGVVALVGAACVYATGLPVAGYAAIAVPHAPVQAAAPMRGSHVRIMEQASPWFQQLGTVTDVGEDGKVAVQTDARTGARFFDAERVVVEAPSRAGVPLMQAAGPVDSSSVALPPVGFAGAVAAGVKKAGMAPKKIFGLGVLSGAQIGLGAALMLAVGGASPMLAANNPGLHKFILGAIGLPSGLFMTLMTGAELFTGNTALVTMAVMEDKADSGQLLKSWITSWVGNLLGSIFLAMLICQAGVIAGGGASIGAATMKTSNSWGTNFVRGILCNWLVCTAVYLASFARDVVGKFVALAIPVSAFVSLGLEHSVANMFIIPFAIFSGAAVTWKAFLFQNLIPVTLGNIVGGAVFMGGMMCWAYGKLGAD